MRIFIDTNIFISALVFRGSTYELLSNLVDNNTILVSEYVVKEFENTITKKWPDRAEILIEYFHKMNFTFCPSSPQALGTVRDEKDIPVLSDAIFNNADILLTGDKDFLESDIKTPKIFSPMMMSEYLK